MRNHNVESAQEADDPPGPMISGRALVLAAVGIGVAMAGAAWWFRAHQSRQAIAFWGPQAATTMASATRVEVMELSRETATPHVGDDAAVSPVAGYVVANRHDISATPGASYLGYALTLDKNFDWEATVAEADAIEWTRWINFEGSDGNSNACVLLSRDLAYASSCSRDGVERPVACPRMAGPLATFFAAAIPQAANDASSEDSASETPAARD